MNLPEELELLCSELNIPSDKFTDIIPTMCRSFVKKYEATPALRMDRLAADLKQLMKTMDVYSQYTCDTLAKYPALHKLQLLVQAIVEGQSSLLVYLSNTVVTSLEETYACSRKVQNMTSKVTEKCTSCARPLKLSELESIQDELGLRFRDNYAYFQQDIDEMHKLSQEASLILRKKNLKVETISEEESLSKLSQMQDNLNMTIEHMSQSLSNITSFQEKFSEFQQHHNHVTKNQKQNPRIAMFDNKDYLIDMTKHFYQMIKKVESKMDKIKKYFKVSYSVPTQTVNQFNECTPQKFNELRKKAADLEVEKRQCNNYINALELQLSDAKAKIKSTEESSLRLKIDKQKYEERNRVLELQLDIVIKKQQIKRKSELNSQGIESNSVDRSKGRQSVRRSKMKDQAELQQVKNAFYNNQNNQRKKSDFYSQNTMSHQIKYGKNKQFSKRLTNVIGSINFLNSKKQVQIGKSTKDAKQTKQIGKNPPKAEAQPRTSVFGLKERSKLSVEQQQSKDLTPSACSSQSVNQKSSQKSIISRRKMVNYRNHVIVEEKSYNSVINSVGEIKQNSRYTTQRELKTNQFSHQFSVTVWPNIRSSQDAVSKASQVSYNTRRKQAARENSQTFIEMPSEAAKQMSENLEKIYHTFKKSQSPTKPITSLQRFKQRFSVVMSKLIKDQQFYDTPVKPKANLEKSRNASVNSFNRTAIKQKTNHVSNMAEQMKKTVKQPSNRNSESLPYQDSKQQSIEHYVKGKSTLSVNKVYTESYDRESKVIQLNRRKSSNLLEEVSMKNPKLNCTSPLLSQNNKSLFETLPVLRKKTEKLSRNGKQKNQSFINIKTLSQQPQQAYEIDEQLQQFTQKDLKTVYHSIQNAYQVGQSNLKQRKSQLNPAKQQQSLQGIEISYMKFFFTKLASIHISNKNGYERIRMFLVCPYDSIISQMSELGIIKTGTHSSAMRESVKKIIALHRGCVSRGSICKHLRYLLHKVSLFDHTAQINQQQAMK